MATFAQNANGTGASQVFVAQDADLDVGFLSANLNQPISFVRVFLGGGLPKRVGAAPSICPSLTRFGLMIGALVPLPRWTGNIFQ
jgi:hypothetical protein